MHFHKAPASTAVRNASISLPHVHHPEARNSDTLNVTGGGPVIQAPSRSKTFTILDDRQTSSSNEQTLMHKVFLCTVSGMNYADVRKISGLSGAIQANTEE